MRAVYALMICMPVLFQSACATGDEIESYLIEPDGAVDFSIYRINLHSQEAGEKAKKELAGFIHNMEKKRGSPFIELAKVHAMKVNVEILHKNSPASVLITGRIPSLNNFAAYFSGEYKNSSIICTPISRERTHGLACELTKKPSNENAQPEKVTTRADSFSETRFALATGSFTEAQGFLLANNRRSAILDEDAIMKMWDSQIRKITLTLEWQFPETP
jgi:hypothetical protein